MNALLLVDLQNDFFPGGAVPVPQGETVIPLANQLQGCFKLVVATQDWHPANHKSFAGSHPGRQAGEVVWIKRERRLLWPSHCVQNTRGAELTPALMMNRVNKILRKGLDAESAGDSAFFDPGQANSTGLFEYLKDKKVTVVHVMGLGTEHSLKATALDAVALGFKTCLIEDACRGWQPEESRRAIEEMKSAGVVTMHSRDLLEIPKAK